MSILNTLINRNLIINEPEDWNGYSLEELQKPYNKIRNLSFTVNISNILKDSYYTLSMVQYRLSSESILKITNYSCNIPHVNDILLVFSTSWDIGYKTSSLSSGETYAYPFLQHVYISNPYSLKVLKNSSADINKGISQKITLQYSSGSSKSITLSGYRTFSQSEQIYCICHLGGIGNIYALDSLGKMGCVIGKNTDSITTSSPNGNYYHFNNNYRVKKYQSFIRLESFNNSISIISDYSNITSVSYSVSFTLPIVTYET